MASKLQFVSELANQTAHSVTRDVDGWKRYLTTASRLYKYPFDEQLLMGEFFYIHSTVAFARCLPLKRITGICLTFFPVFRRSSANTISLERSK